MTEKSECEYSERSSNWTAVMRVHSFDKRGNKVMTENIGNKCLRINQDSCLQRSLKLYSCFATTLSFSETTINLKRKLYTVFSLLPLGKAT